MTDRVGRPLEVRLRVRGWLRTKTPLHVGGIAVDPAEALPVAVDGQGRVYVPGTSLAGALRAWMRGAADDALNELWGFIDDTDPDRGHASRVVVRDGVIAASTATDADGLPADPIDPSTLESRPGVGIDRVTGTAASEILYARTIVPPGAYLRFELDIETTDADRQRDRARLHTLIAALAAAEIRLGAATGRGLGVVELLPSPLSVQEHDFTSPDGLFALLRGESAPVTPTETPSADPELPPRRETLTIRVEWRPAAPVMVRAGQEGASIGALPLTTRRLGRDALVLTLSGSSIKGALRSHAEFIERTVRGVDARIAEPTGSARHHSEAFRDQLDELDAVKALFGTARTSSTGDDTHPWGAGALLADDCTSRTEVPSELWDALTLGTDDAASDPTERPRLPDSVRDRLAERGMDQADHVAIDRWTGGAAHGRLFSVLEPHGVKWEPIRLTIDLTRLGRYRETALALVLLVLRDLRQHRLPLGGMVNRGFGDVIVESITFTGWRWDGATLDEVLTDPALQQAWTAYLESAA
ncbi:hypothetical protein Arub01_25440 [Actinomadura rubrobrunea]|uniref:CRISPR type III-associated protein domain-containing protein n=1 Tax=Actinomadura rubrobrunea TaxID=115335 RepID=A0A9W6PTQ3_9ACTN|nr:RAMP superfamily CRISPR-associated protein [Actinomadura rubrobrunea]GLW64300.1 hypothetical protein Arub01_25440 [Actinomadura rubrobrunea]